MSQQQLEALDQLSRQFERGQAQLQQIKELSDLLTAMNSAKATPINLTSR